MKTGPVETIEDVTEIAMADFETFVNSAPYHTLDEMQAGFKRGIISAIMFFDSGKFLSSHPEVGSWPCDNMFMFENTPSEAVKSAVGKRIWDRNLAHINELSAGKLRENLQEVGLQLLRDVVSDLEDGQSKAKRRLVTLLSEIEQHGITFDNATSVCAALGAGSDQIRLETLGTKDLDREERMYRTFDRVRDFNRLQNHAQEWLAPATGMKM